MTDNKSREQIQAEMRATAERERRNTIFKRIALWGGAAIVLIGMVVGLSLLASSPSGQVASDDTLQDPVVAKDWQKGSASSTLQLVEYSDFQCPYCKVYESYINDILAKYGSKILLVYREFPLTQAHEHAELAARAAEAAGMQGKFWEMHDKLFATQTDWEHNDQAEQMFITYAGELGVDKTKFTSDLHSSAIKDAVEYDIQTGVRANVQATPTFYLNGKKLNLQSYEDLEQIVSEALK